jgi:fibronectin type 3 domain-containing protein/glucose/arabinose dehydrogenase
MTSGHATTDQAGSRRTSLLPRLGAFVAVLAATFAATAGVAAAAVPAKVNFQPASSVTPLGYTADTGAAFSTAAGSGWVRQDSLKKPTHVGLNVSPNAVERNVNIDQRLDTFIQMDFAKGSTVPPGAVTIPAAWEMAVPSGSYEVTVSAGDAGPDLNAAYRINIEGQSAIAFTPTSANHFATATKIVTVTDGRLTLDTGGGSKNTKINYVDIAGYTPPDTTAPAAPANLRATPGNATVTLNWNANTESDLRGYDVYRSTSQPVNTGGTALNGGAPLTTTTFTDMTAANGQTYYYVVVASDTSGNRSAASATVSATPSDGSAPPPPTNMAFNFQPAGAPVPAGYTADTGAAYSADTGRGWVREDSIESASPVPLDVSANARDRNVNADQLLDTFIHMQYPPAGAPATAVTTPAAWAIAVPNGDYTVFVSVGEPGPALDSVHQINIEGQVAIDGFVPTSTNHFASATRTVHVDDGLLMVDARGGTNTKIDYLRITSATADTTPPAAPTNVSATPGDARVTLTWNANTEADLAGYDVFRGTSLPVSTSGTPLGTPPSNGYTDTTAVNGTTYYYAVVARDASGNRSPASAAVSATPQASPSSISRAINFQPAGAPIPAGYTADTGAAYSTTTGQGWIREDSLDGTHVGLDTSPNTRDRNVLSDQRLDTFNHMQYPAAGAPATAVTTPAAWELAVPNGGYTVTVSVGDANAVFDSSNRINIEGQVAISAFVPTSTDHFLSATRTVNVADGRLTIDARGGTNTKIDYVTVTSDTSAARPSVTSVNPADGATGVVRDTAVTAEVRLPNVGAGIDPATLNATTVRLVRNSDGAAVAANRNTTGGGDAIILQPTAALDANTLYRIEVTSGLKDLSGASFLPFGSSFTTGSGTQGGGGSINAQFTKVALANAQGQSYTSLTMGPDNKLYAATLDGYIHRFTVNADGTLGTPQVISSVRTANGGPRTVLGLAWDPAATATNLVLWITHDEYAFDNATDWTGKISRLSGSDLQTVQDYVVGLPRSVRDHETNSAAFGPDGALYVTQGSNSATGAADSQWGLRDEHVLNAAVLRVAIGSITSPPLNVKSEDGGTYNPFAAGAPVTLYASGLRNAFDLVWHSNGQLYAPTNGSAAGGNTPGTPSPLPAACQSRIDSATSGAYTGPSVPALTNIATAQNDYLNRVVKGGYYGHPNPKRCEWVLNGGNPTSGADANEVTQYPAGVQPDRNYRRPAYDFGQHYSPDGVIEYRSSAFGGALRGKLLVVRYSAGDDIIVLTPGTTTPDITAGQTGIPGLTGFVDPLDLTEDTRNGNLYVTELGASRITLLRPAVTGGTPQMSTSPSRLIFNDVQGGTASAAKNVTIRNDGSGPLSLSGLSISGTDAGQFRLLTPPTLPATIAAGSSLQVQVVFDPTSVGPKRATLTISGNDGANPQDTVALRGLGTLGEGGTNEPSLQWILDTYDIPVNVGDPDPTTSSLPTTAIIGDEVPLQQLAKAGTGSVTLEPLAVFGPQSTGGEVTNLGWYPLATGARTQLFSVANAAFQSLDPAVSGGLSFDPGASNFGMSSIWPFFSNRTVFSEDSRNTFDSAVPHHVRAYPLKNTDGSAVANAYVVAVEETTSGQDYQDLVFIIRNVRPAATSTGGQINVTNLDGAPFPDRMVFSRIGSLASPPSNGVHDRATVRISNTGSGSLSINSLTLSGPWQLVSPPALPATIAPGGQLDVTVRFVAESGSTYQGSLTIGSNDSATPSQVVQLAGWWQSQSENGLEPNLVTIVNTILGYKTTLLNPGQSINRQGRVETAGEEVLSAYWQRVDTSKPVSVRQLDAFHTQGNTATLFWHQRDSTTTNAVLTHAGIDGQTLLPRLNGSTTAPAAATFTPSTSFGLKIDTEWSDDTKNDQSADKTNGCPSPCGHHVRFWPARDRAGNRIADTWIVGMDYSGINYDYQDNVYLISNIKPDTTGSVLQRLDVSGASNFTDSVGNVWRPDTNLFTPSTAPAEGAGTTAIDNTVDDTIYRTYRGNVGNVTQDQRVLSYVLPVATATRVDIRLHFAERFWTSPGQRVQDISAEGNVLVNNFDIFASAGAVNRAYVMSLNDVGVADGALNLSFKADIDYPSIAGIEVLCRAGC